MNQKPSHLGKMFIATLIISSVLSFVAFGLFDFEIGIIFTICLVASIIVTALTGIENTIINKDKDL